MIRCISSKLKCDNTYLMQIVSAEAVQPIRVSSKSNYIFKFWVRVWQDAKDLASYNDILVKYFNSRGHIDELIEFVECATGYEFDGVEPDVEFTVGAAFRGVIRLKITYDQYGPDKGYYLEVKKHLDYCEVEGGKRR